MISQNLFPRYENKVDNWETKEKEVLDRMKDELSIEDCFNFTMALRRDIMNHLQELINSNMQQIILLEERNKEIAHFISSMQ